MSREYGQALPVPAGSGFAALVALAPLLYAYLPRPPLRGSHVLAYPILGAALTILILHLLTKRSSIRIGLLGLLLGLLLLNIAVASSFLVNALELRARASFELFRVALLAVFLVYGYVVGDLGGSWQARRGLWIAAWTILVGQFVIATTQIAGVGIFEPLYSEEKVRPLGGLVRATGSLGNPNVFAWTVAQAGIMGMLLGSSRLRYLAPVVAGLLVVSSGSRTMLLLFPLMVVYAVFLGSGDWRQKWKAYLLLGGGIAAAFSATVVFAASYLPYLAQLRLLFNGGSVLAVNSMRARVLNWETVFRQFNNEGLSSWVIGLGARDTTAVLDNDFLYVFFKFGSVGFLIHLVLIGFLGWCFGRKRNDLIALIGFQYLLFSLFWGLVAETLGGWNVPLLLFFLAGITLAVQHARPTDAGATLTGV